MLLSSSYRLRSRVLRCTKIMNQKTILSRTAIAVPSVFVFCKVMNPTTAHCDSVMHIQQEPQVITVPLTPASATTSLFETIKTKILEFWTWLTRFARGTKRIAICGGVASSIFMFAPIALYFKNEELLWKYVVNCLQFLGPTFIKLGQWASSRPDMFPERLTSHLQTLQSSTVTHPWHIAEETLSEAYGPNWKSKFHLDHNPIGSGCIAQVYKGTIKLKSGVVQPIAVKLIHPKVEHQIAEDMDILRAFSWVFELIPDMEYLSVRDIIEEFAELMSNQLDLRLEAAHMRHFRRDFQKERNNIDFPVPIKGYVTKNALMETFSNGTSIVEFMSPETPLELKLKLSKLCSDSMLEMIFQNNFVHGDLHPGNILVEFNNGQPKIVFIDCGIVTKVKKEQFWPMLDICLSLMKWDGRKAGMLLADASAKTEKTKEQLDRFCEGMQNIVLRAAELNYFEHIGEYVTEVCTLSCVNHIKIVPEFFHIAMSIKVSEGIVLALQPDIDMATIAIPVIVKTQATNLVKGAATNLFTRKNAEDESIYFSDENDVE